MGNSELSERHAKYYIPPDYVHRSSRRLGKAAFGSVFLGELRLGVCVTPVAIKRILVSSEDPPPHGMAEKRHVEREIFNMAEVEHENILRIYGGFYTNTDESSLQKANVILEYCAGGTLDLWLRRSEVRDHITLRERIRVLLSIARGLHHLHSHGLIHRDLSRDNVLATSSSLGATMKICDFGLSRHLTSQVFSAVEVGKLPYMPPTFYSDDPRLNDVYSYGILSWEVLTGNRVYDSLLRRGVSPFQVYDLVKQGLRPSSPAPGSNDEENFGQGCPDGLKALICRCWDPNPLERPQMDEIVVQLIDLVPRSEVERLREENARLLREFEELKAVVGGVALQLRDRVVHSLSETQLPTPSPVVRREPLVVTPVEEVEYSPKLQALRDIGFSDAVRNLELLRRYEGNIMRVVRNLCGDSGMVSEESERYSQELEVLRLMGFSDESRNLELLTKHSGNLQNVVTTLASEL